MTLYRSLIFTLLCVSMAAHAQEVIKKTLPLQRSTTTYDSTIFVVNGYKASEKILKLFKPNEISLNRIHDPNVSQEILIMGVQVSDTSHHVLKYLKYKASMDVTYQIFPHGVIPNHVYPNLIKEMDYLVSEGHKSDVLIVKMSMEEEAVQQKSRYQSQPQIIKWYDVDGKVMSQEEMSALNLQLGEFETGDVISGQQAKEKYGDSKYAEGVQVVRRLKKKD